MAEQTTPPARALDVAPVTAVGIGAMVCGLALVTLGWVLVWPAFAIVGAVLVVLVLAAGFYVIRRPAVRIERQISPPRVTKGLPAIAYLHMENRSRRSLPALVATQPYGTMEVKTLLPRLLGGQSGVRTYRLPTTRRGIFPIGPVEIVRGDPFGFARRVQRYTGDDEIWVTPRVLGFHPLPTGIARTLEGPISDVAQEGTITFHRLREYVVGDDLRMVHWRSVAKTGKLVVRHNIDNPQPFTVVLLDIRPSRYSPESFEHAIDVAASVAACASTGKSPVELRTTAGTRVGGERSLEPIAIMDHLTALSPEGSGSLTSELLRLRRERGGTALVVVSGVMEPEELPAVASLRHRFQRLVVISMTPGRGDPLAYPDVTVVTASEPEEVKAAWDLQVAR